MLVRAECIDDYRHAHDADRLWASIVDACVDAGLRNYRGFIGGPDQRTVFAVFDTEDVQESLACLAEDPRNVAWQAHMRPWMELTGGFDDGGLQFLEPVFSINTSRTAQ